MMNSIFVTVLIEGCSSVRMDEGGIEPFSKAGGIPLCVYIKVILKRRELPLLTHSKS
jgi:hypothetical protein